MKNYKDLMEAKLDLPRVSDKQLIAGFHALINSKVLTLGHTDGKWFTLNWGGNDSIFLANNPKEIHKTWEDGLKSIMTVKGVGIPASVLTGIPSKVKHLIRLVNEELKNRKFDNGE